MHAIEGILSKIVQLDDLLAERGGGSYCSMGVEFWKMKKIGDKSW